MTYCRLWQALIKGDTAGIKEYCLKLNAGELYPLLASVITARAWNSIQTGIAKKERTAGEVGDHMGLCLQCPPTTIIDLFLSAYLALKNPFFSRLMAFNFTFWCSLRRYGGTQLCTSVRSRSF